MPIIYNADKIVFQDVCTIDEAEFLLTTLCDSPVPRALDLSEATHLHTAVMQVLMAGKQNFFFETLPHHQPLKEWLEACQ